MRATQGKETTDIGDKKDSSAKGVFLSGKGV